MMPVISSLMLTIVLASYATGLLSSLGRSIPVMGMETAPSGSPGTRPRLRRLPIDRNFKNSANDVGRQSIWMSDIIFERLCLFESTGIINLIKIIKSCIFEEPDLDDLDLFSLLEIFLSPRLLKINLTEKEKRFLIKFWKIKYF